MKHAFFDIGAWLILLAVTIATCVEAKHPFQEAARYINHDQRFDKNMRIAIQPHLIPKKHPAKIFLDHIFASGNAIENETSFAEAGFKTISTKTSSHIRVARHRNLPGYVFKLYLCDMWQTRNGSPVWKALADRCEGAKNIRRLIRRKKISYFTAPKKWLYIVPAKVFNDLDSDKQPQNVILVATDMRPLNSKESFEAWKIIPTEKCLDELYCILSHGYASTFLKDNIPYTSSGMFTCLDTEFPQRVNKYEKVERFIPLSLLKYWHHLVESDQRN